MNTISVISENEKIINVNVSDIYYIDRDYVYLENEKYNHEFRYKQIQNTFVDLGFIETGARVFVNTDKFESVNQDGWNLILEGNKYQIGCSYIVFMEIVKKYFPEVKITSSADKLLAKHFASSKAQMI